MKYIFPTHRLYYNKTNKRDYISFLTSSGRRSEHSRFSFGLWAALIPSHYMSAVLFAAADVGLSTFFPRLICTMRVWSLVVSYILWWGMWISSSAVYRDSAYSVIFISQTLLWLLRLAIYVKPEIEADDRVPPTFFWYYFFKGFLFKCVYSSDLCVCQLMVAQREMRHLFFSSPINRQNLLPSATRSRTSMEPPKKWICSRRNLCQAQNKFLPCKYTWEMMFHSQISHPFLYR